MDEVPVVREPVRAGVLAHGRNDDPVGESQIAKGERVEEMRHLDHCAGSLGLWALGFGVSVETRTTSSRRTDARTGSGGWSRKARGRRRSRRTARIAS